MEQVGRFGGRASEKAGTRDMAMDSFDGGPGSGPRPGGGSSGGGSVSRKEPSHKQPARTPFGYAPHNPGLQNYRDRIYAARTAQLRGGKDAQGFSELENEYNEGMDASPDDMATKIMAILHSRGGKFKWDEDAAWRYIKEEFPRLTQGAMQQIADRVQNMMAGDEYRDEAAEESAERRGYREDKEQVATGPTRPERLEFREPVDIVDASTGRFGGRGSEKAGGRDLAMDPLTSKGEEIKSAMEKQYGPKKGEQVFYASANKGTIKGVHE